ncbi:ATP-dependent Clp protease ATP-binding subunit [Pseudonocardia hydrocarbonoxydans]|uniref:ATPase AAA n=1 Tax=Pseudonocardia hydrocarbonoxydans TaxID=76726 RepID=A0A4Y3WU74_9PSEU|nr:ATP-dependent Clp protease ATP-binding subunit [Pseudonocardia hydrocarbonoxydans]GEC22435.1 hypothetical protein PHY01_47180 [Pseudonocardia hydrocarbonoxydans]
MTGFTGPDDPDASDESLSRFLGSGPAGPRGPARRFDLTRLMSAKARELVSAASQQATERGDTDLDSLHLLLAATRLEPAREWLGRSGVDPDAVGRLLDEHLGHGPPGNGPPSLTPAAKRALLDAHQVARSLGSTYMGPEHILLAIAANDESAAGRLLNQARFSPGGPFPPGYGQGRPGGNPSAPPEQQGGSSTTPMLDQFGQDLTPAARAGRLDPVIGRADEIEQTIEVLSRRTKNNPVLIGEAGVGKTAVVEGIAQRIVDGDVPDTLAGRRVVELQLSGVVAGTRYRGDFEERLRTLIEEIRTHAELSDRYVTDRFLPDKAIDLMDQAGARVRLRTRTPSSDRRGLEQRLEQLERDKDQAVADEQYELATQLRDQINEVRGRLTAQDGPAGGVPEVDVTDIADVVSRSTGIPIAQLTEDERERLLRLEDELHARVVGQDEAVHAVAEAIRRSRAGLGDENRPVGSFLFLGPTGVGKTELARALAVALFGEEDRMVRLDMSEYSERHTVARMVGAPPGYVGYGESGQLTETVRRRPYSVLLLDEIEKAHPDVFNILLQVLDDGRLTDGQGRTVDFRNTVVIMTSNVGSELVTNQGATLGFGSTRGRDTDASMRDAIMPRLRETFRPEFLNRVDEIIVFRRLDTAQLTTITELLLDETRRRLEAQGVTVEFTRAAVERIAELGYQPEFGARPLRRTIQREVDNRLSTLLLAGDLTPGRHVRVHVTHGELEVRVEDPAPAGVG